MITSVSGTAAENRDAGMAELADAQASGACGSNIVRVQVPLPAWKSQALQNFAAPFVWRLRYTDARLKKQLTCGGKVVIYILVAGNR